MTQAVLIKKPCGEMWYNNHLGEIFIVDHIEKDGVVINKDGKPHFIYNGELKKHVQLFDIHDTKVIKRYFEETRTELVTEFAAFVLSASTTHARTIEKLNVMEANLMTALEDIK